MSHVFGLRVWVEGLSLYNKGSYLKGYEPYIEKQRIIVQKRVGLSHSVHFAG